MGYTTLRAAGEDMNGGNVSVKYDGVESGRLLDFKLTHAAAQGARIEAEHACSAPISLDNPARIGQNVATVLSVA